MARLIYSTITSLDGFVDDAEKNFDWAAPDEEVHAFVNDLERPVGTYLYGRRMFEVMSFWETAHLDGEPAPFVDYAHIWQAADKVVYSTTLTGVSASRTHVERTFEPDAVWRMKDLADRDLSVGGPTLAGHALRAGLVDEIHRFLAPVLVGGGTPAFPDGVRLDLELVDEHRFASGFVHLHYRVR